MKWIREHISKMPSFNYLNAHLSTIENTIEVFARQFLLIKLSHTILIGSFKLW